MNAGSDRFARRAWGTVEVVSPEESGLNFENATADTQAFTQIEASMDFGIYV